jgi:hypothetical protein
MKRRSCRAAHGRINGASRPIAPDGGTRQ